MGDGSFVESVTTTTIIMEDDLACAVGCTKEFRNSRSSIMVGCGKIGESRISVRER